MDWDSHPLEIVNKIVEEFGDELTFEFSVYKYVPLSTIDQRRSFWLPADKICRTQLETIFDSLSEGEDLSFHSRVAGTSRAYRHIPMIDFTGELSSEKLDVIERLLPQCFQKKLILFKSGKSYHGYVPTLVDESEWTKFLGLLLLLNYPESSPVTDSRWIGHRLRGGYGALRWSRNSNGYTMFPKRVGTLREARSLLSNICHE